MDWIFDEQLGLFTGKNLNEAREKFFKQLNELNLSGKAGDESCVNYSTQSSAPENKGEKK